MPLKEFVCKACGNVFEKLCKTEDNSFKCPLCGKDAGIKYTGVCNGYKKGGCGGNCSGCKGCRN